MSEVVRQVIETALLECLPSSMRSVEARLMLLTIQKQEDPEELRYQRVARVARTLPENIVDERWAKGPARSLWQEEMGGCIKGVLQHQATAEIALDLCDRFGILPTPGSVWRTVETHDVLAACFARLLLWSDPQPLPKIGAEEQAWRLYLRTWRPGAYTRGDDGQKSALRHKWAQNYSRTMAELGLA